MQSDNASYLVIKADFIVGAKEYSCSVCAMKNSWA